ncbi:MAG: hypothetical protein AB7O68_04440 [Pirellulales bacterium]
MTDGLESSIANRWRDAAVVLKIQVVIPFELQRAEARFRYLALVPHFGRPQGTLIIELDHPQEDLLAELATNEGYYYSSLSQRYSQATVQAIQDTLNDWGWFGPEELRPDWYTGEPWSS